MKIKNYKCTGCGKKDFFFHEKDKAHMGIYCRWCGKYYKWADRNERNLMALQREGREDET